MLCRQSRSGNVGVGTIVGTGVVVGGGVDVGLLSSVRDDLDRCSHGEILLIIIDAMFTPR